MDTLFKDVERSLKTLAKVNLVCGVILALTFLLWGATTEAGFFVFVGIALGGISLIASLIVSWFIYAFAELVESAKETSYTLKLGFAEDVAKEKKKKEEFERARITQKEQERKEYEAKKESEESAKLARIAAYWDNHPKEKKALIEKRIAAEKKLNELGSLAMDQRKALENLIQAIDEEFRKDRETSNG